MRRSILAICGKVVNLFCRFYWETSRVTDTCQQLPETPV